MTRTVNTILAFQSYAVFCLLAMVAMLLLWQNYLNIFILCCTLFSFCALFPNSICSLPQVTQCCEKITCYFQNREVQSTTVKVSKTFFLFLIFFHQFYMETILKPDFMIFCQSSNMCFLNRVSIFDVYQ